MAYVPTQQDVMLVKQPEKEIYIKIELLSKSLKILESLDGSLISDNLNVDSQSKQRRTYNCQIHVLDASFLIGDDKKIWIDKYIRVYYGIRSVHTREIQYFRIGTFTYVNVTYTYSQTENTLDLTCADLMADFDGTKNGQHIGASKLTIPAGEDIRTTIIGTLNEAGITHYYVEDIKKEIPYDIEFSDAHTYCDIWTKICDLYDSWEFFFDVDGMFVWKQMPTGLTDPVMLDDHLFDQIYVDEKTDVSFSGIYNVTEIWGKLLELTNEDRYADNSTLVNGSYHITLEGVNSLDDLDHLDQIGIRINYESANPGSDNVPATVNYPTKDIMVYDTVMVCINGLTPIPMVHDDGRPVKPEELQTDTVYVFQYRRNLGETIQNCLYLLGQYQAYGIYKETNPDCPFSIENLGYEIPQRLNYENLYSDDLCYNQAEYLTYQTTALLDTITLTCLIIPWIDVNQKVAYTSKETGLTNQYMIKSFSWSSLEGTMSLTLYKFIESFSYVKKQQDASERRIYGLRNS